MEQDVYDRIIKYAMAQGKVVEGVHDSQERVRILISALSTIIGICSGAMEQKKEGVK